MARLGLDRTFAELDVGGVEQDGPAVQGSNLITTLQRVARVGQAVQAVQATADLAQVRTQAQSGRQTEDAGRDGGSWYLSTVMRTIVCTKPDHDPTHHASRHLLRSPRQLCSHAGQGQQRSCASFDHAPARQACGADESGRFFRLGGDGVLAALARERA